MIVWKDEGCQDAGRKRCLCSRMSRNGNEVARGCRGRPQYIYLTFPAANQPTHPGKHRQKSSKQDISVGEANPPVSLASWRASPGTCIYSSTKEAARTTERHGNPSRSDEGRHSRCVAGSGTDCFSGKAEGPDYSLSRYWSRKMPGRRWNGGVMMTADFGSHELNVWF
jgi:hypothetical protein